MAPARTKKARASTWSNEDQPTKLPTKADDRQHTPERSASKRIASITQAQKQALVDNLQLEITERARKLRAQYALQAQGLRARLEMRVNRIPQALRKRNMQDLLDEHAEREMPAPAPPVPAKDTAVAQKVLSAPRSPERKSLKRQSDHISTADDDKENAPASSMQSNDELPNPKKRAKTTAAAANTKATRTASRKVIPSTASNVLSPKSHNSRTLPRSPFKPSTTSPEKPNYMRPLSPMKHLAPPAPRAGATSRAGSRQVKGRPGTAMETDTSEASVDSAGTTIVTKPAGREGATAKKAGTAKTAAVGRKPAVPKKENVAPAPAAATRTLRKRG